MSEQPTSPDVNLKRILVALDNSPRGRAALKAALQLAIEVQAELQGLYVEDEDLLRLAALPFAREVDFSSASSRELQAIRMERALRRDAEDTQRAFAEALKNLNLTWAFRIVRGSVTQAPLTEVEGDDLLVIGQWGRSPAVMATDYLFNQWTEGERVAVIFDATSSAFRALELGTKLAKPFPISVVVVAKDSTAATAACQTWLDKSRRNAEVDETTADNLIGFFKGHRPSMLLVNRDSEIVNDDQLRHLFDETSCPVILC